jgi:hypothetical protein
VAVDGRGDGRSAAVRMTSLEESAQMAAEGRGFGAPIRVQGGRDRALVSSRSERRGRLADPGPGGAH